MNPWGGVSCNPPRTVPRRCSERLFFNFRLHSRRNIFDGSDPKREGVNEICAIPPRRSRHVLQGLSRHRLRIAHRPTAPLPTWLPSAAGTQGPAWRLAPLPMLAPSGSPQPPPDGAMPACTLLGPSSPAALRQAPPRWPGCRSLCGRLGPAPSRPHPAPSPDLDNQSPAASVLAAAGSGNDRRFPPLGVKQMPPYGCHPFRRGGVTSRGDMLLTTTTLFSQRAERFPLWLETFTKRRIRRGRTSIFRVRCEEAMRGCASRVPLPPGAAARRTRGEKVEGATPLF